jgi:hypothetical protein
VGHRPPLPEARGPLPHRRAQDQQRAGPGPAGAQDGQEADHRRDRRRPARRRHGDRGGAPGAGVRRLHGPGGHGPAAAQRDPDEDARGRGGAGRFRHRDAEGRAQRGDPRLGHQRADDPLRDRHGRGPGALPGDRRRAPVRDRARGARADAGRGGAPPRVGCRLRGRRVERDRDLPRLPGRRRRCAARRRGGRRGRRDRPPRRVAQPRLARRAARHLLVPAPEPRGAGDRAALDLRGPGLPRGGAGAQLPARLGPGALRQRDRRGGARGLPAVLAQRGDHPGAGELARAGPAGARGRRADGGRAGAGVPVGARRQGRGRGGRGPGAGWLRGRPRAHAGSGRPSRRRAGRCSCPT